MKLLALVVTWCILFVLAWPLALLVVVLAPFIWLLSPKTRRIHKITNQYALAFFNQQLKGIESSLLDDHKKLLK